MAFEVFVTEPAEDDLFEVASYMMAKSPQAARRWFYGIQQAILGLAEMPHRCARIPETGDFIHEYRHLLFGSHRIVIRIDEAARVVFVVWVWHGSRQPLDGQEIEAG